jgi:hypothetical protein
MGGNPMVPNQDYREGEEESPITKCSRGSHTLMSWILLDNSLSVLTVASHTLMHFAKEKYITVHTSSFVHFVSMVIIVQLMLSMGMLPVPANILTTS